MNVVLDTNILRHHGRLQTEEFKALLDYLERTGGSLLIPQIVREEWIGFWEREIEKQVTALTKAKRVLDGINSDLLPILPEINTKATAERYVEQLLRAVGVTPMSILNYGESYLPELVRRSIGRIKPCSQTGGEFRDAILWLSMIKHCVGTRTGAVVFISTNTDEFAESKKEKDRLHAHLSAEAESAGVGVHYYNSISSFLRANAITSSALTNEWLKENLLFEQVLTLLPESVADRIAIRLAHRERITDEWCEITGYYSFDVHEFFVYEKQDQSLFVEAVLWSELEVGTYVEKGSRYSDVDDYEDWLYSSLSEREEDKPFKYKHFGFEAHIVVGISVVNETIENIQLIGFQPL